MLEMLTGRWRKPAAKIRADLGAGLQRTTEGGFRLRFCQKELDMFIPDDVVGMEVHHFSNGNGRVWFAEEETASRLKRSRSDRN